jgi:hypothetical protein
MTERSKDIIAGLFLPVVMVLILLAGWLVLSLNVHL